MKRFLRDWLSDNGLIITPTKGRPFWTVTVRAKNTLSIGDFVISNHGNQVVSVDIWYEGFDADAQDKVGQAYRRAKTAPKSKLANPAQGEQENENMKKLICRIFGHKWWIIGTNGQDRYFCKRCEEGL